MQGDKLNYTETTTVHLPTDDGYYSIRKFDWKRLRRIVSKEPKKEINLPNIYSILYGITGSAGLSILPIYYADNLPSWVTPLYIIVTLFSFVFAFLLTIADKIEAGNKATDFKELIVEMEAIENQYKENQEQNNLEKPKELVASLAIDNNWKINHWGSRCASILNDKIAFSGTTAPAGADGCHIDLNGILEVGTTYEISCFAKSSSNTSGLFQLWCHDRTGTKPDGTDESTEYKTPLTNGEIIKLNFKPGYNKNIRVHLQYTPGQGRIEISDLKIYKLTA